MLAIEAGSVVDGDVIGGNLILTKHDGSQINAGSVTGPKGDPGPIGSDLAVLAAKPVLDVGVPNQIRAGRQLSPADFANIGLAAPLGLWNLSDLSDASGNGRALNNKGAVPFDVGINGLAATAAKFAGSVAQALYIPDIGAADPFRIKTGSWGCWFRVAKRGTFQLVMSKWPTSAGQQSYYCSISNSNNAFAVTISTTGSDAVGVSGVTDISDDKWHFAVITHDGTELRLYIDGTLDAATPITGTIFGGTAPLNIGGYAADGGAATNAPFFGRVDEAFITADVLSDDQVRKLYCAKIAHTLGVIPSRATMNVRRRRRGASLVAGDFSTQPLRLHNFSAASLGDEGSNAVALTNNGAAVSVAGSDGAAGNSFSFAGAQSLSASDAGLPAALTSRSYGCWFKAARQTGSSQVIMGWGTLATSDLLFIQGQGYIGSGSGADFINGTYVADGLWHHAVVVEDNAPIDGLKRKLYLDGRIGPYGVTSTVLNALTLGGANFFRIGCDPSGAQFFTGQVDAAFICNYALTLEQIIALYTKSSQDLGRSPKSVGEHIERMDATALLFTGDTLEPQYTIDLGVAA
jgi:hypothetical protein